MTVTVYTGGASVDVIVNQPTSAAPFLDLEMIDEATILAAGAMSLPPLITEPEFLTESTGLKYLRFCSDPNNERLLSWFIPIGSHDEVYFRYLLYIEPDVKVGMTAQGVKLPGPTIYPSEKISLRLEHAPLTNAAFPLVTYFYSVESGSGTGKIESLGANLQEGRHYCIEGRIKLNDAGVPNGIYEVRVDGVTTRLRTDVHYRDDPALTLNCFHVNVYHGGQSTFVSSPIHYRIAKIYAGPTWGGVPPEMPVYVPPPPPPPQPGAFPAWRNGKAKDVPFQIANTANMNGQALLGNGTNAQGNTLDAWNGLARHGTEWFALAGSGHDQNNGNGWENKAIKIDLNADAPQWLLVHPGSPNSAVIPAAYYSDGLPCARHTYHSAHWIASHARLMLFGAAAPYSLGFAPSTQYPNPFNGGGQVDGFNPVTATWDAAGTWASSPTVYASMAVAVDPRTDDVFISHSSNFYKWTAAANSWARIFPLENGAYNNGTMLGNWRQGCPSIIDAQRNRLVYIGDREFSFMDLTTHECTTLAVTGPYPGTDAGSAMVHDLGNDRYVCVQGTQFYAIDPATGASTALGGAVPAAVNGVEGRLAYFPSLGGVAYASSYFHNVTFLPTL